MIIGVLAVAPNFVSIAKAASLTQSQIDAIISLLQSFGTNQATTNNVQTALGGGAGDGASTSVWCHDFNKNLRYGDNNSEVGNLKTALIKDGIMPYMAVTYEFDEETVSYIVAFQKKYKDEILTPLGLKYGTGFVGKTTRVKLNELYGCVTPTKCTMKWWFDSITTVCSRKQFCGAYIYYGLQTFDTQTDCQAHLPSLNTYTLTVTKSGTGSGTVTSNPAGINCGTTCSTSYTSGTSVTLTASPASGSTFAGWSGACSGTGACTISMTQARNVIATFNIAAETTSACGPYPDQTVKGSTSGSSVWGSNPYTDDSDFNKAAIHAGLISVGQTATIRKTSAGYLYNFVGSTSNGVTTSGWTSGWCGVTLSIVSTPTSLENSHLEQMASILEAIQITINQIRTIIEKLKQ